MKNGMRLTAFMVLIIILAFRCALPSAKGQPGPVFFPVTGNFYDAISVGGGITWDEAKTWAESLFHEGVQGHLATIGSQAENDFIISNLGGPNTLNRYLLGGFQPSLSPEPGGNWQWITGEAWGYTNWAFEEPNNFYGGELGGAPVGSDEEVLQFWDFNGRWNDVESSLNQPGFIVEYPTGETTEDRLLALEQDLGSLHTTVADLEDAENQHQATISGLVEKMTNLETRFGMLETDIKELKESVDWTKTAFEWLIAQLVPKKLLNDSLHLLGVDTTYHPNDERAPAGVFKITSTYTNNSTIPFSIVFFETATLEGPGLPLHCPERGR